MLHPSESCGLDRESARVAGGVVIDHSTGGQADFVRLPPQYAIMSEDAEPCMSNPALADHGPVVLYSRTCRIMRPRSACQFSRGCHHDKNTPNIGFPDETPRSLSTAWRDGISMRNSYLLEHTLLFAESANAAMIELYPLALTWSTSGCKFTTSNCFDTAQ